MKIAFISQYFFPEQFSNNAIAEELVRRGHRVHVFPCVPNYPTGTFVNGYSNSSKRNEIWNGVSISRAFTIPRGRKGFQLIANYVFYPFAASWTIFRRLKERADVSFISMPSPLLQALAGIFLRWRTGTPCVYWVQDLWPESATLTLGIKNRLVLRLLNAICGWIYRQADLVMVQSEAFREAVEKFGVPSHLIRALPNTAPENYRPMSPTDASELASLVPQHGFRLMFAGNIGESQDFDTLISAAIVLRDRSDLHWLIVGSGRDEERARKLVATHGLGDRFYFLGRHAEEAMPKFFAHADAMLVSLKNAPIFALTVPYKVQCYLACGKPIIASLSGEGARIVSESGAGIAVDAGQPEQLANAIRQMIDGGHDQRDRYAKAAKRYFDKNYSAEKIYGELERALGDVVATRQGTS